MVRLPYRVRYRLASYFHPWPYLRRNVLEVRNFAFLKDALAWSRDPKVDYDFIDEYGHHGDLNHRRLRDAEVVGGACCNVTADTILEIGTAHGQMTTLMAQNAPEATVYTINIPPEEITQGGKFVTFAPERNEIGRYYRQLGIANIRQIYANTATWEPDFAPIDVAFIDGSHDSEFVYNDTRKVLSKCRPGSIVIWHDFAPSLGYVHAWIGEVCHGIDRLYRDGLLKGPILHLQDSWIGLYRVDDKRISHD